MENPFELYLQAEQAAKNGNQQEALDLLIRLVETDPRNELGWVLLSKIVTNRQDLQIALENIITLNPYNEDAQKRLAALHQQIKKDANEQLRKAQALFEQTQKKFKKRDQRTQVLRDLHTVVSLNPNHENAWYALSRLTPDFEDQITALKQVLAINPGHGEAGDRLTWLQELQQKPLQLGLIYEEIGELERAKIVYQKLHSNSVSARVWELANQRWRRLEVHQELGIKAFSPNFTLLRLTAGMPLLYITLTLTNAGLNPFQVKPLFWAGLLGVIVGSFLIALANPFPRHPFWFAFQQRNRLQDDSSWRVLTGFVGWMVMLLPYLLMYLDAVDAFNEYILAGGF